MNYDFNEHDAQYQDLFDFKDLNFVFKKLNKNSASGEDRIHNLMINNSISDFRQIILRLINETVRQSKLPLNFMRIIMIMNKQHNSSKS